MLCYYTLALRNAVYAPVAQLDRVTDYESVGRGFESLLAYQGKIIRTLSQQEKGSDCFCIWGSNNKNANVRWTFARRRLDDADTVV